MYEKGLLEVKTDQKTDHFGKKVRFPDFRRQTGPKYQLCIIHTIFLPGGLDRTNDDTRWKCKTVQIALNRDITSSSMSKKQTTISKASRFYIVLRVSSI